MSDVYDITEQYNVRLRLTTGRRDAGLRLSTLKNLGI